jgi:hypothetical protein
MQQARLAFVACEWSAHPCPSPRTLPQSQQPDLREPAKEETVVLLLGTNSRRHRRARGWTSSRQATRSDQANKISYGFSLSGLPAAGLPFFPTGGPATPRWLRPECALDGAGNQRTNGGALGCSTLPERGMKIVWDVDRGSDAHAIIMSLPASRRSVWQHGLCRVMAGRGSMKLRRRA